jgi:hypothetical protein
MEQVVVLPAAKSKKAMLFNYKNRTILFLLCLTGIATGAVGCSSGCVKCTGITADQLVCKGDFSETADYNAYIQEYQDEGGICEE